MWDVIVAGGGTSGIAAGVASARAGCRTLIIEKNSYLGGTATGGLVMPMMRNILDNGENLNGGLYLEILEKLAISGHSAIHKDGNQGWFDPEMMKCALDDMCEESGVDILFNTTVTGVNKESDKILSLDCINKSGSTNLKALYFIDATGDADIAALAGVPFELGDSEEAYTGIFLDENNHKHQSFSLRFTLANVDLEVFAKFLLEIDPDSPVSSVVYDNTGQILLTTAHTWDGDLWKLRPYFKNAVQEKIIEPEDGAYFQLFSIPGQKNAISLNCPRIYSEKNLHPLNMWDVSYALKQGRKQIRRLARFCISYLPGFEDSYISQIAPELGVRDSRRIRGKYRLTEEDIFNGKKCPLSAAKSNYPVDIHSDEKGKSVLKHLPKNEYYEIPYESLVASEINNLAVVGRCISASFRAQASLRIQPNCWAMGEYAGKSAAEKLNKR